MSESIKIPFIVHLVIFLVGGMSIYNAYSIHQLNKRLSVQLNLGMATKVNNTNGAVSLESQNLIERDPESESLADSTNSTNSGADSFSVDSEAEDLLQSQQRQQERIELEEKLKMELAEQTSHTESYENDAAKVESLLDKIELLQTSVEK